MPKWLCICGAKLQSSGPVPHPDGFHVLSETDFDQHAGSPEFEYLPWAASAFVCRSCGRLWVFWNGVDAEASVYDDERGPGAPYPSLGGPLRQLPGERLRGVVNEVVAQLAPSVRAVLEAAGVRFAEETVYDGPGPTQWALVELDGGQRYALVHHYAHPEGFLELRAPVSDRPPAAVVEEFARRLGLDQSQVTWTAPAWPELRRVFNVIAYVSAWAARELPELLSRADHVRFQRTHDDRDKHSLNISVEHRERAADLTVWQSGEAELIHAEAGRAPVQRHYEVADEAECAALLNDFSASF